MNEIAPFPNANSGDVERGHWRWSDHSFTPNASLLAVKLDDVSDASLDANLNFINAVRVRVRRESVPASSYFSRIIGFDNFQMQAEAVAYVGFAGSFLEGEASGPIALCEQAILNDQGQYTCVTGRMINSGNTDTHNTAAWTNFTQEPCQTTNTSTVNPYAACSALPPPELTLQVGMGTIGGQLQTSWNLFYNCYMATADTDNDGIPDTAMNLTLPVIDCPNNNVLTCSTLVGAVNVNMVMMVNIASPSYDWAPLTMTGPSGFDDWECSTDITGGKPREELTSGQLALYWASFSQHFNLTSYGGLKVDTFARSSLNKSMFFVPDCSGHVRIGVTAGPNLGVLAKIPVLVE